MYPGKTKTVLLIILFMTMIPSLVSAEIKNEIQYEFIQTDSTLSFYGSFKTDKSPDCLLDIFFNYNHIKALAPDAMEVQLIDQGHNWNRFRYIYKRFIFFENISVWQRKFDMEKQRVDIILESSVNNLAAIPTMISSSCYFRIIKPGEDIMVEYHQHCQLKKSSLTNFLLNALRKEAVSFMKKLSDYSNTMCGGRISPDTLPTCVLTSLSCT